MVQTLKEAEFLSIFFWLKNAVKLVKTRIPIKLIAIYIKTFVLLHPFAHWVDMVYCHLFTFPTFIMNISFFPVLPKQIEQTPWKSCLEVEMFWFSSCFSILQNPVSW